MGDFRVQIFPLRGFFPGTTTHHPYYQSKVTHYDHIVLEKLSPYGFEVYFALISIKSAPYDLDIV